MARLTAGTRDLPAGFANPGNAAGAGGQAGVPEDMNLFSKLLNTSDT